MRRIGWLVMTILLTAPTWHECCLPALPTIEHCHQSKDRDNAACSANPAAIAESANVPAFFLADLRFPLTEIRGLAHVDPAVTAASERTSANTPPAVLYLRTGVLLI